MNNSLPVWSISKINEYIRSLLEQDILLEDLLCEGEVSNLTYHDSGHVYFSCKDKHSSISCVMFRSYAEKLEFKLTNGMRIIFRGGVSIYEKAGKYQIYVRDVMPEGKGGLYAGLEQLKAALQSEGLFSYEHKRPIPRYAKTVAVITSETGAVIHDIVSIARRKNSAVKIVLVPVTVQGESSSARIVQAVSDVNTWGKADVLIIARGGGSSEDLWPFNSESVARAVFASKIPVISAIGHQTDITLCDLAADLRVETPSAAAELAVYDQSGVQETLENAMFLMDSAMSEKAEFWQSQVSALGKKLSEAFCSSSEQKARSVSLLSDMIGRALSKKLADAETCFLSLAEKLELVSPVNIMKKGYLPVFAANGASVRLADELSVNERIKIFFSDGHVTADVVSIGRSRHE